MQIGSEQTPLTLTTCSSATARNMASEGLSLGTHASVLLPLAKPHLNRCGAACPRKPPEYYDFDLFQRADPA